MKGEEGVFGDDYAAGHGARSGTTCGDQWRDGDVCEQAILTSVGQPRDDAAIRQSRQRPYVILVSMATSRYPWLRKMLKLAYSTGPDATKC
jgi:hypothetical protein